MSFCLSTRERARRAAPRRSAGSTPSAAADPRSEASVSEAPESSEAGRMASLK